MADNSTNAEKMAQKILGRDATKAAEYLLNAVRCLGCGRICKTSDEKEREFCKQCMKEGIN